MDKKFADEIHRLFRAEFQTRFTEFREDNKALPPPAIALYEHSASAELAFFVLVVGSMKWDQFTVEVAFSRNHVFPFGGTNSHPFDKEGNLKPEIWQADSYRLRLSQLWGGVRSFVWAPSPRPSAEAMTSAIERFAQKSNAGTPNAEGELQASVPSIALPELVRDAIDRIDKYAIPFFGKLRNEITSGSGAPKT